MAVRTSHAEWNGSLKEGAGTMKLASGAYEGPFTFVSRFENGDGTNPEELIGAAHAGCYSMFLTAILGKEGHSPQQVKTSAAVHLGEGPAITKIELVCEAKVPGMDDATFQSFATRAKEGCPISKALSAVPEITLQAKLV